MSKLIITLGLVYTSIIQIILLLICIILLIFIVLFLIKIYRKFK